MKTLLKGGLIGGLLGVLVWLYDHDFLLNAGGPSSPISDVLVRMYFGVPQAVDPSGLPAIPPSSLLPWVFFILFFAVIGLLIGYGIQQLKKHRLE